MDKPTIMLEKLWQRIHEVQQDGKYFYVADVDEEFLNEVEECIDKYYKISKKNEIGAMGV